MELTIDQKKALKGKGYLVYQDDIHFSCRVVTPAGKLSAEQAKKIAEVSTKYGRGSFYFTQRLNVEIPWVEYKNLERLTCDLAEVGLTIGSTGMRVRPVLTCKGSVCKFSLNDTDALTLKLNERFYTDLKLPNKLRISIAGCSNNCSSPQLSCIGIQLRKANLGAIMIGGKELSGLYSTDEAMDIIEKAISYYKENGLEGERFANMIERIGFHTVEKALISNKA